MALQVIQSLVFKNSKAIVLPVWVEGEEGYGNLAHPDVYVLDTYQQYPIATKFVDGDKVFHYGYIQSDTGAASRGGLGLGSLSEMKSVTMHSDGEPVGETELKIVDTTSTLNEWAGGMFMTYVAPYFQGFRVLSNTATDETNSVLTLERGLLVALTASLASNELYANQYRKLNACWVTGDHATSCMGILIPAAVASRYCWVQTWGPAIVAGGDEVPGSESNYRMGAVNIDGTLVQPTQHYGQNLGHVINDTTTSYVASHYIYLMIAC